MILCPLLNAELDEEEKLRLRGIMSTPSDERVEWLRKHKNRPDYKIYQPTKEEVEYTVSLIESYDPFIHMFAARAVCRINFSDV